MHGENLKSTEVCYDNTVAACWNKPTRYKHCVFSSFIAYFALGRSTAYSKANTQQSGIKCFLFQIPLPSLLLKVIH